jgi:hypothetical protein
MILQLSFSSHYDDVFVEITEEEFTEIVRIQDKKYLQDTQEGRDCIDRLLAKPHIKIPMVVAYI